ncbi:type II secretion system F family protein [bacterium]|nr:type II secretion system F family protein [bacterium]MBU3955102.1 type II secretion system F family protein [bacterium]
MNVMVLLIILCSFLTVTLLLEAVFHLRKQKIISDRIKGERLEVGRGVKALFLRLAISLGKQIETYDIEFISKTLANIDDKLKMAGISKITPPTFMGISILASIGNTLIIAYLALGATDLFTLLLMAVLGYFIPGLLVNAKIKTRQMAIFRDLPDTLDILTLLIEAGLDFGAALNILIEKEKGPLIDELAIAQQEIKLGANRISALQNTIKRARHKHLTSVLNALIQAMRTGSSIGGTLRALSDQYRVERALFAEKLGAEAPLKMMGPLILFIFPTIFIIIFGPLVLSFMSGKIW